LFKVPRLIAMVAGGRLLGAWTRERPYKMVSADTLWSKSDAASSSNVEAVL
jgi:hypothetical protein